MPRRSYHVFTPAQVAYLRQHYRTLAPAHFAQQWGVRVQQVHELARRHGIRRRAPNGQPVWRTPRPVPSPSTLPALVSA